MKELFGVFAIILGIVAYTPYLRDLIARRIQPHPYSWLIWGTTTGIMAALQFFNGGGALSWVTLAIAIINLCICIVSWRQGGSRLITRQDTLAVFAAVLALVLWLLAREPLLSMLLLVCVDILGFIPTVRKTWLKPHSETLVMWSIETVRHGVSIFAISTLSLLTLVNPVVWIVCCFGFIAMVLLRRRILETNNSIAS